MTERFNPDGLALSARYAETMNAEILPALDALRQVIPMKGDGDRPLYVERFDAERPRGTVTVVHGFTENAFKYSELTFSLLRNGFSVLALDQRGHGRSWRDPEISDLSLTHVDHFEEYVKDLKRVCDAALADMPKPWYVFCHSMGGAVTGLFLEQYPGVFEKAVMCAPMIAPNRSGLPLWAAKALGGLGKLTGQGKKRIFVSRPYAGPEDFATSAAVGRERFDWYDAAKAATPAFQNNGPTYGWLLEAVNVTAKLLAPGAVEKIAIPVLLYTAERDGSVLPAEQKLFIDRVKDGRHGYVAGAKHEIYRSTDEIFFPWWHEILVFLKRNPSAEG